MSRLVRYAPSFIWICHWFVSKMQDLAYFFLIGERRVVWLCSLVRAISEVGHLIRDARVVGVEQDSAFWLFRQYRRKTRLLFSGSEIQRKFVRQVKELVNSCITTLKLRSEFYPFTSFELFAGFIS